MDRVLNPAAPVRRRPSPEAGRFGVAPPVRAYGPYQPAPPAGVSPFRKLGLYSYCLYLFSGYANDLSIHFFGGKAYLTWLAGILVLISFIGCGTALRGLGHKVGKAWLALALCMLLSAPFSIWKSESAGLLEAYLPKVLGLYFYGCAFAVTLRQCRTLILGNVACTSAILLCAALFGGADEGGRFSIPSSLFFGGANDLALALVCSLGFTLFLILQKSVWAQALGAAEFLITLFYLLKTGSRGGFLALAAFLAVWFFFSGRASKLVALAIPALAIVAVLPGSTLGRLVEIAAPGAAATDAAPGDALTSDALASQMERTMLLKKSVVFALTHPILGLGPGTFIDALYNEDLINRTHTHALGTHNTYTQLASECGLPVLFLYLTVLFGSIGSNYRIMKRTRKMPGGERVFTMAVCLLGSLVAFAVGSGFHHVGYSTTLPILSGMSVALAMASKGGDPAWIEAEIAAGNV